MTRTFSKIAAALAMLSSTQPAFACGAEPYFGEICYYAFNFCPRNMTALNGSTLPIAQNSALFSLLGTTYGGDGKSNFALPNLQGSAPMHPGQGPGLSLHDLGETGGSDTVSLIESEIPSHVHALNTYNDIGEDRIPNSTEAMARSTGGNLYASPNALTQLSPSALAPAGEGGGSWLVWLTGLVLPGRPDAFPHEGPNVFVMGGRYWLIVDEWHGQGVFHSTDAITWTRQGIILADPGVVEEHGERPGRRPEHEPGRRHAAVRARDDHPAGAAFVDCGDRVEQVQGAGGHGQTPAHARTGICAHSACPKLSDVGPATPLTFSNHTLKHM